MLKKPFLLFFSLLGAIFILASCGVGKDAVTGTKLVCSKLLKSTKKKPATANH